MADIQAQHQAKMPLRKSARMSRTPKKFVLGIDYVMFINYGEPSCYKEAMMCEDQHKWENAM